MTHPDDFYRAFEDRHRGTPQGVEERQRAYLPFLAALKAGEESAAIVDLGCGRGEWLALARAQGWRAQGVDTDAAMLQSARDAGLDVHQADAVAHLRSLPAASLAAVTAFHVVEHLPFDQLRAMLLEAARVLRPGGLLILETPNPENLVVGSSAFHMDPTHVRPLPPALLAFAVEFAGFDRVATLRLHEGVNDARAVELIDVLAGVSPDYAVVARMPGGAASPELDALFAQKRGVTLNDLADRYDFQLREIRMTAELAREAAMRLDFSQRELRARVEELESGAALLQVPGAPPAQLRDRVLRMLAHMEGLEYKVSALESSTSWRITAPLRRAGQWRLRFANRVHAVLEGVPGLHAATRAIARALHLVPNRPAPTVPAAEAVDGAALELPPPLPADHLTASARGVQDAMRDAMHGAGARKDG